MSLSFERFRGFSIFGIKPFTYSVERVIINAENKMLRIDKKNVAKMFSRSMQLLREHGTFTLSYKGEERALPVSLDEDSESLTEVSIRLHEEKIIIKTDKLISYLELSKSGIILHENDSVYHYSEKDRENNKNTKKIEIIDKYQGILNRVEKKLNPFRSSPSRRSLFNV